MVQPSSSPRGLSTDIDHHPVLLPTRPAPPATAELPAKKSLRPARIRKARITKREIGQVAVLRVNCRLVDVVEDLDQAIQLALAEGPPGVVCDLSTVLEGAEPVAVEILATAGRHVRDWPGVPVAVACPDPRIREALRAHPLGEHLIVTTSLFTAVSAVLAVPAMTVEWLRLAPHPTAPRASREFVTRTLVGWGVGQVIPFASLVVSELVASSSIDAGTAIDLSVAWDCGALRLTVRDHGPGLPGQPHSAPDLKGRRLTLVAGLSRTFGVLPTADGGTVLWAVLDAPRSPASTSPHRSAAARQESLILNDARGLAELPIHADSVPAPVQAPGPGPHYEQVSDGVGVK